MRYNYASSFYRVSIINFKDNNKEINLTTSLTATLENTELKIATFNLFNYLEPPNAAYEFERIFSVGQWQKKQTWISEYLREYQPDIIGFQEVFSPDSLKALVAAQGYDYFAIVDQPQVIDEFIYRKPVVAIASRYPIVDVSAVKSNIELAKSLGLNENFSFSRQVLRATVNAPHIGHCDCYVVHFKSKRPIIEVDEKNKNWSPEQSIIERLKAQVVGGWGSTIQRGSEATLLMINMIERREATSYPMVLMGDFNNTLDDGVLNHLLTNNLRFVSNTDRDAYLAKYCLYDAWNLYQSVLSNEFHKTYSSDDTNSVDSNIIDANAKKNTTSRTPTHYFGASSSVLDYVLLSCEFDASYHDSLYEVSEYHTYDRHLINPIFDHDGESTDHGIVLVTLALRS